MFSKAFSKSAPGVTSKIANAYIFTFHIRIETILIAAMSAAVYRREAVTCHQNKRAFICH